MVDVFYLLDILVTLRTGVQPANMNESTVAMAVVSYDAMSILATYARKWLWVDFVSRRADAAAATSTPCAAARTPRRAMGTREPPRAARSIPWDRIINGARGGGEDSGLALLRMVRLLRLLRLLKLQRGLKRLKDQGMVNPAAIKIGQLMFSLVFCAHLAACAWCAAQRSNPRTRGRVYPPCALESLRSASHHGWRGRYAVGMAMHHAGHTAWVAYYTLAEAEHEWGEVGLDEPDGGDASEMSYEMVAAALRVTRVPIVDASFFQKWISSM